MPTACRSNIAPLQKQRATWPHYSAVYEQIACAWEPARSVGGDYFDVLTLAPNQLGICIADVSGKGITAALLMADLQAAVRAFAPVSGGPGSAVRQAQRSAVPEALLQESS
jgi:serine phosphatase RsbU (regulator of sigma subunit)